MSAQMKYTVYSEAVETSHELSRLSREMREYCIYYKETDKHQMKNINDYTERWVTKQQ